MAWWLIGGVPIPDPEGDDLGDSGYFAPTPDPVDVPDLKRGAIAGILSTALIAVFVCWTFSDIRYSPDGWMIAALVCATISMGLFLTLLFAVLFSKPNIADEGEVRHGSMR